MEQNGKFSVLHNWAVADLCDKIKKQNLAACALRRLRTAAAGEKKCRAAGDLPAGETWYPDSGRGGKARPRGITAQS